jgi:polygalacturonase
MKSFFLLPMVAGVLLVAIESTPAQTNVPPAEKKIRIVLVGDSTVNDAGGWGRSFKEFLTGNLECINTAANGRSSKSFIDEGRWKAALALKGDYYLIQFGHNDEPGKGPERETEPNTTYYQNMTRYVHDARAIGAKPVLVTSLTRRTFDQSGNGKIVSTLTPYVAAVRRLAAAEQVPLVDLNASSTAYCEEIGPARAAGFNPIVKGKSDATHLNAQGQLIFARQVVVALRQAVPELAPDLRSVPDPAAAMPDKLFDVKKYGAAGDGQTDDTPAIQKAVDACAAAGGGVVKFPAGTYLSKPIFLKGDNLTVQLDAGAKLLASDHFADFAVPEKAGAVRAFVNADGLDNLTLTGKGMIDGAGAAWWREMRSAQKSGRPEPRRPRLVWLQHCHHLRIEGITLQNSPSFHLVPGNCDDVAVTGVTIRAPADSPNTDATDPSGCRHVVYSQCTFDVGDDNIAIKSGQVDPAHPDAAVEDMLVENCTFLAGHGMSIGSETTGGVKYLTVRDCTFDGTTSGIRIKSDRTRGGLVESCTYSNLTMRNVKIPINITCYYPKIPATDSSLPVTDKTPRYRNLKIVNVTAESPRSAGFLIGLPECCVSNVVFENVHITAPTGLTVRNARAVQFLNSDIQTKSGSALILETNAEVTGIK